MTKMTTRFTTICTLKRRYRKHTFYVDIILDHKEQVYRAWIWEDRYGVKSLMFGILVHGTRFGEPYDTTVDEFTEMAMDDYNFKESADLYIEEYMDGEEN